MQVPNARLGGGSDPRLSAVHQRVTGAWEAQREVLEELEPQRVLQAPRQQPMRARANGT